VSVGAYVSPGKVLTTIEDLNRLKVDFTVPESMANAVKKGDRIRFRLEGVQDVHEAVVDAVDPSVNTSTGNLRALAVVESPSPSLKAGMAVSIDIEVRSASAGLYLPSQALIPSPSGYHVYVTEGGLAKSRPVKTGLRTDRMVEIREGIEAGDTVLVTGFMKVRPDMKVNIIKTR
jgi:membrane fusion protein (multidrug efflux system)